MTKISKDPMFTLFLWSAVALIAFVTVLGCYSYGYTWIKTTYTHERR